MACIILCPNGGLNAFEAGGNFVGIGAGAVSVVATEEVGVCDGLVSCARGRVLRGPGGGEDGGDKEDEGELCVHSGFDVRNIVQIDCVI